MNSLTTAEPVIHNRTTPRPYRVVIVGTIDVNARIQLMQSLGPEFAPSAIGSSQSLKTAFAQAGFEYRVCEMSRRANPVADLRSLRDMVRLLREIRPDVVHTFDTKPCVWGRLSAILARVPVVVGTITGLGTLYVGTDLRTRLLRCIYRPLQRLACHRSDLTMFYNRDDARDFLEEGIVRNGAYAVVPGSGIATDRFSPDSVTAADRDRVRRDACLRDDETTITMITRVCRSKGVLEFAEAARIIRSENPRVRFLLVGAADQDVLDGLSPAETARVTESVTWLGERRDIAAILAVSDVCALPTAYREGIPRALLEAASMGLPLVATDVPGCREVVQPGVNGLLVDVHDAAQLAAALNQLIVNKALRRRFGLASRQRAIADFDIKIVSARVAGLYRSLLARKSGLGVDTFRPLQVQP